MPDDRLFEVLSHWNLWGNALFDTGIRRETLGHVYPWLHRPEVVAICGMRRTGKSTLMRQLARELVDQGAAVARDTLFVNFEEPVLLEHRQDAATLDRVFETYVELARPRSMPHLFLDEVQNVDGWARWVRSRTETGRARVVVSGSSSRILEPEIGTVLTGRNITWTLWPLSFVEFLQFRGLHFADEAELLTQGQRVRQELVQYLRFGGLPEVVLADTDQVREALLKQYFRDMLYRDVVSRHQVRDVRALEQVAHYYLANTANLATYNRIKNTHGLAMDQVRSYASHLAECYLVREVPRYSPKISAQSRAPRKVYAMDTGIRNAVAFRFSQDSGRLAETAVHNHLVRDDEARLFYHQGRGELDFLVWKGDRAVHAIQVCYDPTDTLPDREVAGLQEAMTATGLTEGLILTEGIEREIEGEQGKRILVRPLWRWLCEQGAAW